MPDIFMHNILKYAGSLVSSHVRYEPTLLLTIAKWLFYSESGSSGTEGSEPVPMRGRLGCAVEA